ncbi:uncharacterized protein LOC144489296 [Mustelus asterias]
MSTFELNVGFFPVAEQKPAKLSLKRRRFLLRRDRLKRRAYLKKKLGGAPAQEGHPQPAPPPRQGPVSAAKLACPGLGNGVPAGKGAQQSGKGAQQSGKGGQQSGKGGQQSGKGGQQSGKGGQQSGKGGQQSGKGGQQSGKGGQQSGKGGQQSGKGAHQSGCQDSKPWKFTPPSSSSSRPPTARPVAPPTASALLLSECQSALPRLDVAPPPAHPYPAFGGKAAPCDPQRPYKCVALDCEMVGTRGPGKRSELARCSIIGYHGDLVYDKYILPPNPITDLRTRWSGIRWHHMRNATPFKLAQKEILKILYGKIVIGHAIHNDFKALKYFHPQPMTRDTSKIPLLNKKGGFSEKETVSLKRLTKALLDRDIQMGKQGHSSVEDARATMELYRLAEAELELEQFAQSTPK